MTQPHNTVARAYWAVTLLLLCVGAVMAYMAPTDASAGPIQKLIYLHLPVAINSLAAALVVGLASVAYMHSRGSRWDDLAQATAAVTVLNATVLLLTGMFWAKVAWGHWWVWSPRLSFSLAFWFLYLVYLVIRRQIRPATRRAAVCALCGVIAFLNVPLLYLSAKLLPDIHPTATGLTSGMYAPLWVWLAGITLLSAGTIAAKFRLAGIDKNDWSATPGARGAARGA